MNEAQKAKLGASPAFSPVGIFGDPVDLEMVMHFAIVYRMVVFLIVSDWL
jgi:hypothetical protein